MNIELKATEVHREGDDGLVECEVKINRRPTAGLMIRNKKTGLFVPDADFARALRGATGANYDHVVSALGDVCAAAFADGPAPGDDSDLEGPERDEEGKVVKPVRRSKARA